jgi:glycosyltransferase involved in cell wall biosynthesis
MGFKNTVVHIPNCVESGKFTPCFTASENSVAFMGRLSREKGLETLVDAVKGMDIRLKIIGDGPIRESLSDKIRNENIRNVDLLGYRTGQDLIRELQSSMFVVIPSEWYENNPLSVIEAFALGKPVLGARIGGIHELVRDWETGLTFESGNAMDLRQKMEAMLDRKDTIAEMGKTARRFVEENLNEDLYYTRLMAVYEEAMGKHK